MKKTPVIGLLILPFVLAGCGTTSEVPSTTTPETPSVEGDPTDFDGYYANTDIYDPDVEYVELQTELHNLMIETHHTYPKYSEALNHFKAGADLSDTTNYMMEFYWSGTQVHRNANSSNRYEDNAGNTYTLNREHVWPKSKSNGLFTEVDFSTHNDAGAGSDILHIRPAVAETNSAHWAWKYGYVDKTGAYASEIVEGETTAGWIDSSQQIFEPKDEFKGDTARILLYVYMHYSNAYGEVNKWCGSLPLLQVIVNDDQNIQDVYDILIEWNKLDPVSEMETLRNDYAFTVQGNRNPFVDYPSLVDRMLPVLDED